MKRSNGPFRYKWGKVMKIHWKKNIKSICLLIGIVCGVVVLSGVCKAEYKAAPVEEALISYSEKNAQAVLNYLNEMYIQKYPEMGLEMQYGSELDKEVLKELSGQIVAGKSTDREKVDAVIAWVKANIKYRESALALASLPIDVYYEGYANCCGYAEFMQCMLRAAGVPTVIGYGYYKDMNTFTLSDLSSDERVGHAWIYVYYDEEWHIVDLLSNNSEVNYEDWGKWYYIDYVEGVVPYYEGIEDTPLYQEGIVLYKNGKLYTYFEGKLHGDGIQIFISVWNDISYEFYGTRNNSSITYVDNPDKINSQINGESYYDEWVFEANNNSYFYIRGNGTVSNNIIYEYNGNTYFSAIGNNQVILKSGSSPYRISHSGLYLVKGENLVISPTWSETEYDEERYTIFTSDNPSVATVDENGNITGLSKGYATITMVEKDADDPDTHFGWCSVLICVGDSERKLSYTVKIPTEETTSTETPSESEINSEIEHETEIDSEMDSETEKTEDGFSGKKQMSDKNKIESGQLEDNIKEFLRGDADKKRFICDGPRELSKNIFSEIKECEKDIEINITNSKNELEYSWLFAGNTITDTELNIDLTLSFNSEKADEIKKKTGKEDVFCIHFAHHGCLPGPATIKTYVGDSYKDGSIVYLYYFDEEKQEVCIVGKHPLEVKDGYVEFTILHCSTYFLDKEKLDVKMDESSLNDAQVTVESLVVENNKYKLKDGTVIGKIEGTESNIGLVFFIIVLLLTLAGVTTGIVYYKKRM